MARILTIIAVALWLPLQAAVSSLDLPTSTSNATASYNQWLGTSIQAGAAADPEVFAGGLTMRIQKLVPNANTTIMIVGETGLAPDLSKVLAVYDTSPFDSLPTGVDSLVTVLPDPEILPLGHLPSVEGERAWIVFGVTAPDFDQALATGLYYWRFATATGPTIDDEHDYSVGDRVAESGTAGTGWSSSVDTPYSFSLEIVPEPGVAMLTAIAAISLLRRKR
ncbi:hypothetical protein [Haloferula helveola]|uniref:hypothetical protein n=1 Tax=Haloferula helveola TaxID=490095 RepID=UPI0030D08A02